MALINLGGVYLSKEIVLKCDGVRGAKHDMKIMTSDSYYVYTQISAAG